MISQKPITMSKVVVIRDLIFYAAILILLVVVLFDGHFYPLECTLLIVGFVVYLVLVFMSPLVKKGFRRTKDITNPNITTTFIASETIESDEDLSYGMYHS